MIDVLERITLLREKKNWTEYQLAEHSGLTQSTISSWYKKSMLPTISSLEKICEAYNISLSEFFADNLDNPYELTSQQQKLFDNAFKLSTEQLDALIEFMDTL